jgi:hypothetical protein
VSPRHHAAKKQIHSADLERLILSNDEDDLIAAAGNHALNEDLALTLVRRRDLPRKALEALSHNHAAIKSRQVMAAVATHQHTPRYVALPLLRHLFTFELMGIALQPGVAADVKQLADQLLIDKLPTISEGERLSLAKRGSHAVAAALLDDPVARIIEAALENPRMTEAPIVRALVKEDCSQILSLTVSHHDSWPLRPDIRRAALRNPYTPFSQAIRFAESFRKTELEDLMRYSRLPEDIKAYLLQMTERRKRK